MDIKEELLELSDRYSGRMQEVLILAAARIDKLEKQLLSNPPTPSAPTSPGCVHCGAPATARHIDPQSGSSSNVCSVCYKKEKYVEMVYAHAGVSMKVEDVTFQHLLSVGLA